VSPLYRISSNSSCFHYPQLPKGTCCTLLRFPQSSYASRALSLQLVYAISAKGPSPPLPPIPPPPQVLQPTCRTLLRFTASFYASRPHMTPAALNQSAIQQPSPQPIPIKPPPKPLPVLPLPLQDHPQPAKTSGGWCFSTCLRYLPVWLVGCSATVSGVPTTTISPPLSPPSGPRSMIQSAKRIT